VASGRGLLSNQSRSRGPSLGELQTQFPARLQGAIDQALDLLDELREDRGETPTVTVALHTSDELDSEAALDRFLGELSRAPAQRARIGPPRAARVSDKKSAPSAAATERDRGAGQAEQRKACPAATHTGAASRADAA
jgi:hypothetical protein